MSMLTLYKGCSANYKKVEHNLSEKKKHKETLNAFSLENN